ncbi:hypothetical protein ACFGVR_13040 [Mucilaginibacter sp. AW1-3]
MNIQNSKWWWFATATLLLNALLVVYSIQVNSELNVIEYTLLIEFAGGLLISVINLLALQKAIVYRASLGAAAGSAATVFSFIIYIMCFAHIVC